MKRSLLSLCLALLAACSNGNATTEIDVPPGWDSRVAERGFPLPGALILYIASFPLPAEDDEAATNAEKALGPNDVLLILSESLEDLNLPVEAPRIAPGDRGASMGRRTVIDKYVVVNGRSFALHATFGTRPPPKRLVRSANAVLAGLSVPKRTEPLRPAPDPPPASALALPRLFSTPVRVVNQCRLAHARVAFPILCPLRMPRPFVGWPRGSVPEPWAQRLPDGGLSIGYGAPWEPDSGPDWQLHLWRNRPCCFLHFEVFRRREGAQNVPAGARPATLGGRRGLLKDATSYGLASAENDYLYWANHTRFLWREHGVPYVATLHRFGTQRETRALLDRLLRELRPVR